MNSSDKHGAEHHEVTRADSEEIAKVDGYVTYGLAKSRYDEYATPRTTLPPLVRTYLGGLGASSVVGHYNTSQFLSR